MGRGARTGLRPFAGGGLLREERAPAAIGPSEAALREREERAERHGPSRERGAAAAASSSLRGSTQLNSFAQRFYELRHLREV